MDGKQIVIGREYGYRERPRQRLPLERVRIVGSARRHWKAEWIEPHPGLQDYVTSQQIIVPWEKRRPYLQDENCWVSLASVSDAQWPGRGHPLADAVDTVLESTGEDVWVFSYGTLTCDRDVFERITTRAHITISISPPGYVDRQSQVHLPFSSALELAQAFSAAEPQTVLFAVDTAEDKYELDARQGDNHLVALVQHWRAGWALCRQWAGFDQALAQRNAEIERLKRIIEDLRYELRRAGQDDLATKLDRKLGR